VGLLLAGCYAVARFQAALEAARRAGFPVPRTYVPERAADVDAITISVANMHRHGLDTDVAVGAITIAAVANTIVKAGIAAVLGGRPIALTVAAVLLPVAAVGTLVGVLGS